MTCVLLAHRDFGFFGPRLRAAFPQINLITAAELPAADARLADAEVIMAVDHPFNDARLARAVKLRWIQAMTTGTDAIERSAALRKEVIVTNMRGVQGPQLAEMAFLYMLNLARRFPEMLDNQRRHLWKRWDQVRLAGKTALVIGTGVIAAELAPRCKAFGM